MFLQEHRQVPKHSRESRLRFSTVVPNLGKVKVHQQHEPASDTGASTTSKCQRKNETMKTNLTLIKCPTYSVSSTAGAPCEFHMIESLFVPVRRAESCSSSSSIHMPAERRALRLKNSNESQGEDCVALRVFIHLELHVSFFVVLRILLVRNFTSASILSHSYN